MKLESLEYPIECPKCGKEFKAKIGRGQDEVKITCPFCGGVMRADVKEVRAALDAANRELDALSKALGKLGKCR